MKKRIPLWTLFVSFFLLCTTAIAFSQTPFWQPTNGPEGGDVTSIVFTPQGSVLAAIRAGSIFRSTDNGASWTPAAPFPDYRGNTSIAISPKSGSIFAAAWYDVVRSDNEGASWVNTGLPRLDGWTAVTIWIKRDGTVFAAPNSCNEMYRSDDNGSSWTSLHDGLPSTCFTSFDEDSLGQVYAGTWNGIYRSSDNGQTWDQVGLAGQGVSALGVDPHGHIFAGSEPGLIFRSVDGTSWEQVASVNPRVSTRVTCFAFGAGGKMFAGTSGFNGGNGIFWSENDWKTWSYVGPREISINAVAINSFGHVFVGTTGAGVYRSTDAGGTWARVTQGMRATESFSLLFNANGQLLAAARSGGIHRSDDQGQTWNLLDPQLFFSSGMLWTGGCSALAMTSAGVIFYAWGGTYEWAKGGIARSRDNGNTWEERVGPEVNGLAAGCVAIDHRDYVYAFSQSAGMYRSTDGGASWQYIGLQGYAISSIATTPAGSILASGYDYTPEISGVFRSTDEGQNWTRVGLHNQGGVGCITVSPNGHIFLTSNITGIHRSTDDGQTWVNVHPTGIGPIAINSEGRIFVGNGEEFLSSTDDGATWAHNYHPYPGPWLLDFAFDSEGYLYAGTWGDGVWRSTETTFLVKTVAIDIKPGAYPNTVNLGSGGAVPVAILSSESFDATTVDPLSVTLAGSYVRLKGKGTPMASFEDVNKDGLLDLLVHVDTEALDLTDTSTEAVLEGKTFSGRRIKGTDTVKVIP